MFTNTDTIEHGTGMATRNNTYLGAPVYFGVYGTCPTTKPTFFVCPFFLDYAQDLNNEVNLMMTRC